MVVEPEPEPVEPEEFDSVGYLRIWRFFSSESRQMPFVADMTFLLFPMYLAARAGLILFRFRWSWTDYGVGDFSNSLLNWF